jgi:hypothetical protein
MYRFNNSPSAPRPNYLRNPALHCFCIRQINVVGASLCYTQYNWIGGGLSFTKALCLKKRYLYPRSPVAAFTVTLYVITVKTNNSERLVFNIPFFFQWPQLLYGNVFTLIKLFRKKKNCVISYI